VRRSASWAEKPGTDYRASATGHRSSASPVPVRPAELHESPRALPTYCARPGRGERSGTRVLSQVASSHRNLNRPAPSERTPCLGRRQRQATIEAGEERGRRIHWAARGVARRATSSYHLVLRSAKVHSQRRLVLIRPVFMARPRPWFDAAFGTRWRTRRRMVTVDAVCRRLEDASNAAQAYAWITLAETARGFAALSITNSSRRDS
jgi:hypothetical protein